MEDYIYIKTATNEYTKIAHQEILWIESEGHFCTIHCEERKAIYLKISLSNLEKTLPKTLFVRIRRNTMVNKMHVTGINTLNDQLTLNGLILSIGRTFRAKVLEQFNFLG